MPALPNPSDDPEPYVYIRVGAVKFSCERMPARLITALVSLLASGITWWLSTQL